jgi:hypothetical protein
MLAGIELSSPVSKQFSYGDYKKSQSFAGISLQCDAISLRFAMRRAWATVGLILDRADVRKTNPGSFFLPMHLDGVKKKFQTR